MIPSHRITFAGNAIENYLTKVQGIAPSNLIALWPLSEASGTTAFDQSGGGRDGAYVNTPTLGQTGIGDGGTAPLFVTASTQYVNAYTASLASAFNNQELSLSIWLKASATSDWTDATNRRIALFGADATNFIRILRTDNTGNVQVQYDAGGTNKTQTTNCAGSTSWISLILTVSKSNDRVLGYKNGVSLGAAATGLGTWSGSLNSARCLIGAEAGPAATWNGNLALCALWTVELTAAQALAVATVP